jgi:hypothetical protein
MSRKYHAHTHSLTRGEARFPVPFQVNISSIGGIFNDEFSSFNFFSTFPVLFEVDLQNG